MLGRIAALETQGGVPAVRDPGERRVERRAQARHELRQRVGEVFVLAAPEAVTGHDDAAAEQRVVGVACGERSAFVLGEQAAQHSAAMRVELLAKARPIERRNGGVR